MTLSADTLNLLAELDEPAVTCTDALCVGVRDFLAGPGRIAEQAARWQQALRLADITERAPDARACLVELDQKVGAMRRLTTEVEQCLRDLVATSREMAEVVDRLRAQVGGDAERQGTGMDAGSPQ